MKNNLFLQSLFFLCMSFPWGTAAAAAPNVLNTTNNGSGAENDGKTLSELIDEGIKNSFGIQNESRKLEKAKMQKWDTYTALLPTLTMTGGRTMTRSQSFSYGEKTTTKTYKNALTFTADWVLWNNFQNISNIQLQHVSEDVQKMTSDRKVQEFVLELLEAYFQWQLMHTEKSILQGRLEQAQWTFDKAKGLVDAGARTMVDTFDSEIELNNIQREMLELEYKLQNAQRDLQFLINPNSESKTEIKFVSLLEIKPYFVTNFAEELKNILQQWKESFETVNPDLLLAKKGLEYSRINLRQKKLSYFPAISASMQRNYDLSNKVDSTVATGERDDLSSTSLGINFTWSMWDWLSTHRSVQSEMKDFEISRNEYAEAKFRKEKEIISYLQRYEILVKSIEAGEIILKKSQMQYDYSKEMYSLGKITIYEWQQSITRLFEAQESQAQKMQEKYLLMGKILFSMGKNLLPTT